MKVVVASDMHYSVNNLLCIVPVINGADCFVFCGDGADEVWANSGGIFSRMVIVKGNCDIGSTFEDKLCVNLGVNTFVTHGNRYGVKQDLSLLSLAAGKERCSLALFGHTHRFCDHVDGGVRCINPGALENGEYVILNIGDKITCERKVAL